MNKLAIGIAGALVLAMALSGTTSAATLPADYEGNNVEVDNPYVCSAPSTQEALLAGDPNALPATCDNGDYVRSGFGLSHGFSAVPYAAESWTGHFESWLVHDGDDRGFRCTFEAGTLVACAGLGGAFPGIGSTFHHECRAFESGTGLELPIAAHDWGCAVLGDVTPA